MIENLRSVFIYCKKRSLFFNSHMVLCITILMLFLITSCNTTFEMTKPSGHAAQTDISVAEYQPSEILLKASPVEVKPARSTQWDDDEEMHHHDNEHSN